MIWYKCISAANRIQTHNSRTKDFQSCISIILISTLITAWCVRYNQVWEVLQDWAEHIVNRMKCFAEIHIAAFTVQSILRLWETWRYSGSPIFPIKVCYTVCICDVASYHNYFHMYISYYNVIPCHLSF